MEVQRVRRRVHPEGQEAPHKMEELSAMHLASELALTYQKTISSTNLTTGFPDLTILPATPCPISMHCRRCDYTCKQLLMRALFVNLQFRRGLAKRANEMRRQQMWERSKPTTAAPATR